MDQATTQRNTGTKQEPQIRLYWLREQGCDAGLPVTLADLEPAVRDRVADLIATADRSDSRWMVRLPFLDKRDWRRRNEILSGMPLERLGDLIRCVLEPAQATRDTAATYALLDPAWQKAPLPTQGKYFETWQPVSVALQSEIKASIARGYFADVSRFEDRQLAYTVIAYQASRVFHGQSRTELTYDLRDYPECTSTLSQALRLTGRATQEVLQEVEQRLLEAGRPELSRRYAPMWFEDVLVAERKRPRDLVELLAAEITVINAVIDLGSDRSVQNINRCSRVINQAFRCVLGIDMRHLGASVLDTATRVLADKAAERGDYAIPGRSMENCNVSAAGRPNGRVGR